MLIGSCNFQPTAEQIRYAQLLNTEDSKAMKDKIKQVPFFTLNQL